VLLVLRARCIHSDVFAGRWEGHHPAETPSHASKQTVQSPPCPSCASPFCVCPSSPSSPSCAASVPDPETHRCLQRQRVGGTGAESAEGGSRDWVGRPSRHQAPALAGTVLTLSVAAGRPIVPLAHFVGTRRAV
jgi:hypothetical protein